MIAVDTNLLVYAHREDSPWHAAALAAMTGLAEGRAAWAIPWPCAHEFLSIVTHPRIYRPPSPLAVAVRALQAWAASPAVRFLGEGSDHLTRLAALALAAKVEGPLIHDARIVAICADHGVRELWTADRDFSRFPSLKSRNPLV
jgi:uncharacterized protein